MSDLTSKDARHYRLDVAFPRAYDAELLRFIFHYYILPAREHFINISDISVDGKRGLRFTYVEPQSKGMVDTSIVVKRPLEISVTPSQEMREDALQQIRDDIAISVSHFEEQIRRTTIYFAWVEGQRTVPENVNQRRTVNRLFTDSMVLLFIVFLVANFVLIQFLYPIIGMYTPVAIILFQLIVVFFSDRIIFRQGNWAITKDNPKMHLISYTLPPREFQDLIARYDTEDFLEMKKEIYKRTLEIGREIDCESAATVFNQYGITCTPDYLTSNTVDVFGVVNRVADKFNLPAPRITVMNTMVPNAAASGPYPRRGVVLITTGLLVQLTTEELEGVIGHEFSHLSNHDPLIMFGLTSVEYLLRAYIFFNIPMFSFIFFIIPYFYLLFSMGVIYFIAKFLEARCDLDAAVKLGKPKVLAQALREIGYRKLEYERIASVRVQEWLGLDPHPPMYFRVSRLEGLSTPVEIPHTTRQSIKDCIGGLMKSLRG